MTNKPLTFKTERSLIRIKRITEILRGRKLSSREISAELHCDVSMTTEYLRHMRHDKPRRVRICGYVNNSKTPLYQLGNKADEPMTPKTKKQKYEEIKADPARYNRILARGRARNKALRDAVPVEKRQRIRLRKEDDAENRIVELLDKNPGCSLAMIAAKLEIRERSVLTLLRKLKTSGLVQRVPNTLSRVWLYQLPSRPVPEPLRIRPQGIFAALGL